MEASGAGLGQAQGAGGDAGGQGAEAQQQQQQSPADLLGFDPQALVATLTDVQSSQEGLRELLQAQAAGGQGGDGGDGGEQQFDLSFLDPMSGLDPAQMGERLQTVINGAAERIADSRMQKLQNDVINPLVQRLDEGDRMQMIRDLREELPDLAQEDTAKQVVGLSTQLVQAYGWPQEMAGDPRLWKLTYLASRAADAHQEEQQQIDGGQDQLAALLEGRGGPGPAGAGQVDLGEQIVSGGGRRGAGALPFG